MAHYTFDIIKYTLITEEGGNVQGLHRNDALADGTSNKLYCSHFKSRKSVSVR